MTNMNNGATSDRILTVESSRVVHLQRTYRQGDKPVMRVVKNRHYDSMMNTFLADSRR